MGTVGTFDAFTTARLGIYAAYKGLSLTGNNISNINTPGYTRQVLDQVSLKTGAHDMYRSQYDNHIGNGTLVTGISQIRDPYLDIRFRNTNADVGYYDETLSGLQQIASILDEVGKGENYGDGMLYAQLQDLADSLRAISADPCKDNDTLARTSADALVGLFNKYAERLENLRLDFEDSLNQDVRTVNGILTNIRNLNESIRESDIHGDPALEMRDERNRQIDELSQYMHIKVTYTMEEIGGGIEVERCTIALANDNPDPDVTTDSSILIDGIFGSQIDIPEKLPVMNPDYDPEKAALNKNTGSKWAAGYMYLKAGPDGKVTDPPQYTNDVEKAATVDNDNYTVTISKLYNAIGEEWTKSATTWDVVDGDVGVKAKYTCTIDNSQNWEAGDEIQLFGPDGQPILGADGKQLTITVTGPQQPDNGTVEGEGGETGETEGEGGGTGGTEGEGGAVGLAEGDAAEAEDAGISISVAQANNPAKLAAAIAKALDGNAAYKNYDVRSNGGTIIFTAQNPGAVKADADEGIPTKVPELTLKLVDADNPDAEPKTVNFEMNEVRTGVDVEYPKGYQPGTVTTWNPDGSTTEVTYIAGEKNWVKCTVTTEYTYGVTLDDNDLHGSLQATRELLTEAGEFSTNDTIANVDESAKSKRGIPYYQQSFDLLARQFAEQYNKLNQGFMVNEKGNYIDADGSELLLAGEAISKANGLTADQKQALIDGGCIVEGEVDEDGNPVNPVPDLNRWLKAKGAKEPDGVGVLFSNRGDGDDTEGITAANISISASWSGGSVKIVPTMVELFGKTPEPQLDENGDPLPNTTQNENVNHMITMINQSLIYDPRSMVEDAAGTKLFQGSFNDMFSNMNIVLGNDQRKTNIKLNSQYTSLVEIDSSREGVSGVDLNDEAMNMMQYQKAYSAACRLMTAIDEALERLINNTGIAGR